MSKIMSTSGSHPPLVKGSAPGNEAAGDAGTAAMFAALFGGMQMAGVDAEAEAEATSEAVHADGELVIDPHLAQMLSAAGKGHMPVEPGADERTEEGDDADGLLALAGLDGPAEGEDDTDRSAEAGLLAVGTTPSAAAQAGQGTAARSPLAALAEDMKQGGANANNRQTASATISASTLADAVGDDASDQEPDFIGPPPPRTLAKSGDLAGDLAGDLTKPGNGPAAMARLHAAAQAAAAGQKSADARVQAQTPSQMQPEFMAEAGADDIVLDGASMKAERLSDPAMRLADRSVRTTTGPSASSPASVADAQAGLSTGGGQNANAQTGGQQSGAGAGFAGTLNADMAEQWLDVLDMQDEKWTDQLVRRIDREMRSGGNGLDLELNPRNLGRLKVNLSMVHDQTNVVLRTETGAAAQVITDAESRLAQMLEAAGLKLGQFDAFAGGQNRGFAQQQDGRNGNDNQDQASGSEPETDSKTGDTKLSDGLVNLTA